jgi:hypothetical protein
MVPSPGVNRGAARSITLGALSDNVSFVTFADVRNRSAGSRLLAKIPQANVGCIVRGRFRGVGLRWSGLVIGRRANSMQIESHSACANLIEARAPSLRLTAKVNLGKVLFV